MYSALWTYVWQQLFAKFSIMSLYYRLFRVNHRFSLCIYALMIYHTAWVIAVSAVLSVQCRPLGKFWDPLIPGRCIRESTFIAFMESINSFGDFLLVALAISMVRILQISKVNKRRLAILFGSGAIAGIIGFLKIGLSFNRSWTFIEKSLCESPNWEDILIRSTVVCIQVGLPTLQIPIQWQASGPTSRQWYALCAAAHLCISPYFRGLISGDASNPNPV